MLNSLQRDVKLIVFSRGVRAFAFSYLNIVFAIYLNRIGYTTVVIGIIHSVAYFSGALLTAVWGYTSDRIGRKNVLTLLAILTILSNTILILSTNLAFILLAVVIINVGAGGSAGGGQGGGTFNPVEHALLAEKCSAEKRNQIFAITSFVGSVLGSLGALMSGLPQYLEEACPADIVIGIIHSVAYISGALLTAVWGYTSDRIGRKNVLTLLAILTILSNTILILSTNLAFILLAVVIINVGAGGSAGGGQGGGTFNPVEHALLAEKCSAEKRNQIFAITSFVGSVLGSLGALMSGLPQYLEEVWAWNTVNSYKPLFGLTCLLSLTLVFIYRAIHEEHRPQVKQQVFTKQSRGFVTKMSLLGILDNMGAGMISPLFSYWFFLRFGVELKALGILFSISYLFAAVSFLIAPILSRIPRWDSLKNAGFPPVPKCLIRYSET